MQGISTKDQKTYQAGKKAYFEGRTRNACPFGSSDIKDKSFWLAGWADADIETVGINHFGRDDDD